MLTVSALEQFGANTSEGLSRCLNNEQFYLKLVSKAIEGDEPDKLSAALSEGDLKTAFELAHALKGVYGNLSLTPLFEPVNQMTELLRSGTQTDYSGYMNAINEKLNALRAL